MEILQFSKYQIIVLIMIKIDCSIGQVRKLNSPMTCAIKSTVVDIGTVNSAIECTCRCQMISKGKCTQMSCISPLTLRVRIPLRWGVLDTTLCGRWFSPISSTTKTDIFIKVVLNSRKENVHRWALIQTWNVRYSARTSLRIHHHGQFLFNLPGHCTVLISEVR
jgi:hypothetical protein